MSRHESTATAINQKIRVQAGADGYLGSTLQSLYHISDELRTFVLPELDEIAEPFLAIEYVSRPSVLGYYRMRTGAGLSDEIVIASRVQKIGAAVGALTVSVLAHELLHLVERRTQHAAVIEKPPKKSRGNYHSDWFCVRALQAGIPSNSQGHFRGIVAHDSPISELLRRLAISIPSALHFPLVETKPNQLIDALFPREAPKRSSPSMTRWICETCSQKAWVSAKQPLEVHCSNCQQPFVKG